MSKADDVIALADSLIGSPYVYGTWGQRCTPALRKRYAGYNPSQKEITYKRCQVLRPNNPLPNCDGCKYQGMLAFDCRGYTHYCLKNGAGIEISGGYVKRQWSDDNWDVKGDISYILPDAVSCLFIADMSHTGIYLTGGRVDHCSGEVKTEVLGDGRKWAKFAVPKGLYSWEELSCMVTLPTDRVLKKGSQGADVMALQIYLNVLGYSCGTADGIYGKKTVDAVKAFQAANGLTADGIAGPKTLELIAGEDADQEPPDEEPEEPTIHDELLEVKTHLENALGLIKELLGE